MNGADEGMAQRLREAPNFVQLLISATPFNLLTKNTRIRRKNVIEWAEAIKGGEGKYLEVSPGKNYVGLSDFLARTAQCEETPGLAEVAPLRSDPRFEELIRGNAVDVVDALAADYMFSLCICFCKSHPEQTWKQVSEIAKESSTGRTRKAFDAVVQMSGDVKKRVEKFPVTETDRIIDDLINSREPTMKVVRIAPSTEGRGSSSESADQAKANLSFLQPIRRLVRKLNFGDRFAVLGDFGKLNPQEDLPKKYPRLWVQMQTKAGTCRHSTRSGVECTCEHFQEGARPAKCSSCLHAHRDFQSYEVSRIVSQNERSPFRVSNERQKNLRISEVCRCCL